VLRIAQSVWNTCMNSNSRIFSFYLIAIAICCALSAFDMRRAWIVVLSTLLTVFALHFFSIRIRRVALTLASRKATVVTALILLVGFCLSIAAIPTGIELLVNVGAALCVFSLLLLIWNDMKPI
jgi:hypothetical protein